MSGEMINSMPPSRVDDRHIIFAGGLMVAPFDVISMFDFK